MRVEVPSAIWRKQRAGELDVAQAATLLLAFEQDLRGRSDAPARFAMAGLSEGILGDAPKLCATDGLKAYDAIQLATLTAVATAADVTAFACFDEQLRTSAARRGFALLPA